MTGRVTGAVTSFLGIGGGGVVAGIDPIFMLIVALSIAAGFIFGWEKKEVKKFISFLNSEQQKR